MTMTTAALLSRAQNGGVGNAGEPKPTRRRFSADYKLAILREYDEAERGEKGEILRREGLYSSQLMDWRLQRDEATARQLEPKGAPVEALARVQRDRAPEEAERAAHRATR
jgi:transposase